MDPILEKLKNEIKSIEDEVQQRTKTLQESITSIQHIRKERESLVALIRDQRHIIENLEEKINKTTDQMTKETNFVQDSEKFLEQKIQQINNNKQRIKQHIKNKEELQKQISLLQERLKDY